MPFFKSACQRLWEEAKEKRDLKIILIKPDDFGRRQARRCSIEVRAPGRKGRDKQENERERSLASKQQLRAKSAAERDDTLESQLRDKREAAGGQMAPQVYPYERGYVPSLKKSAVQHELQGEVPARTTQLGGSTCQHGYDQPYFGIQQSRPYSDETKRCAASIHSSVRHELEGDMPVAHLSVVTTRGPYELPVPQQQQRSSHPVASADENWNTGHHQSYQLPFTGLFSQFQPNDAGPEIQDSGDQGYQQSDQLDTRDSNLRSKFTEDKFSNFDVFEGLFAVKSAWEDPFPYIVQNNNLALSGFY